jgi:hypothetical protein
MATRRDFLGASAVAAAAFPLARFQDALNAPFQHRQVFGAHGIDGAGVLSQMKNSLNAYEFDLGEGPGTLHVAAVFYGGASPLGVDDAAWTTYRLAKALAARGDDVSWIEPDAQGSPVARPRRPFDPLARPGDPLHPSADGSIEGLTKRGASFFVCNNALMGLATFLATSSPFGGGRGVDAILADLQAHLAPGAILVPAGVAALNAAQEAKFTYVAAS